MKSAVDLSMFKRNAEEITYEVLLPALLNMFLDNLRHFYTPNQSFLWTIFN